MLKSDGQMPYYKNENSASRDEEPLGIIQIGTDGLSVAGGEAEAEAASRAHAFRLYQPGSRGGWSGVGSSSWRAQTNRTLKHGSIRSSGATSCS
eukprot:COSAG06_NODE_34626_length_472_cov_0.536193_2_plen_93_part_01